MLSQVLNRLSFVGIKQGSLMNSTFISFCQAWQDVVMQNIRRIFVSDIAISSSEELRPGNGENPGTDIDACYTFRVASIISQYSLSFWIYRALQASYHLSSYLSYLMLLVNYFFLGSFALEYAIATALLGFFPAAISVFILDCIVF
jgi:hypothetical protein